MAHVDEQTALIRALFAAAAGGATECEAADGGDSAVAGAPWQDMLQRLRQVTRADGAALWLDPARGRGPSWVHGTMAGPEAAIRRSLRFDRVYGADELPGDPGDAGALRVVKARAGTHLQATLGIARQSHRQDFRSADGQQLNALAPFLGQAAEIWARHQAARERAARDAGLAAGLGAGWLLLDATGLILDLSPAARTWGAALGLQLAARRRLDLADGARALALRGGLTACLAGEGPVPLTLSRDPLVELVLTRDPGPGDAAILARLRHSMPCAAIPPARIARHFALTLSEARLTALICDGHSLRDAAHRLGWTEATARTCSKAIFARLGVSGQPGLVRRVLSGALWLEA
ncbi:helix-turn-helix transcriptional regulator [Pseudooceanicola aestuarii]|uniref:helix-turn-helix transcriptional regulator n=1 Tax=Pseudooceanicola aestuarii TaxID=2697319 RepID=UPI0013D3B741|nr:hypothetical protein [Pseudooceanicola aestuarii]